MTNKLKYKKGDILLYKDEEGSYILKIIGINKNNKYYPRLDFWGQEFPYKVRILRIITEETYYAYELGEIDNYRKEFMEHYGYKLNKLNRLLYAL